MPDKTLITVQEAATRLNLDANSVYRLSREQILPCVRIGRTIRFDPDVLEEWIRSGGKSWSNGWKKRSS